MGIDIQQALTLNDDSYHHINISRTKVYLDGALVNYLTKERIESLFKHIVETRGPTNFDDIKYIYSAQFWVKNNVIVRQGITFSASETENTPLLDQVLVNVQVDKNNSNML